MLTAKSRILNTYGFLPDTGLLLILTISLAYFLLTAGCTQNRRKIAAPVENSLIDSSLAVDINSANAAELEKLPGVGAQIARRIVEHREWHGKFRRPEHLILVRGMSDKKFRQIRNLVKAE